MATKNKKIKKADVRPIDAYFQSYDENYRQSPNRWIHSVCALVILFGISGLVWFIPFPRLDFLGRYNGFVNWFTFFMAILIYYYYRLSPMLSYFMLFTFGLFSYLFVQLEYWEQGDGPRPWLFCLGVFVVGWIGQFVGHGIVGKRLSFLADVRFLLIGPLWIWLSAFRKMGLRY